MNKYLFGILLFIAGCSTPHTYYFPSTSGQFPEVSGRLWGGSVETNLASATGVEVVRDIKTTPPRVDNTTTNGQLLLAGANMLVALGVSERFEVYLTRGAGLRYQFMGIPKQEGWKGTVFAQQITRGLRTSSGTASAGVYPYEASTTSSATEAGVAIGYSPVPSNTLFMTFLAGSGRAKTTVTQPGNVEYLYDDKFNNFLMSLGARFGKTWYSEFEVSISLIQWPRTAETVVGGGNFGFGYQW